MSNEYIEPFEIFFLQKVRLGLEASKQKLSNFDQTCLLLTVKDLLDGSYSKKAIIYLISHSVDALQIAFANEGQLTPDNATIKWREENSELYRHSDRLICCITQKWYITKGRNQELQLRRCGMLYTWYSKSALVLWDQLLKPG